MSHIKPRNTITEIELVYRGRSKNSRRPVITRSHEAYALFLKNWDDQLLDIQQEVKIMLLDAKNRCIGVAHLSKGSMTECVLDMQLAFALALKARAAAFILAHNNPSGCLQFSETDRVQAKRIVEAGKLLAVQFLDHLVISREGYSSFHDLGLFRPKSMFSVFGSGRFSPEGYLCPPFAHL